MTQRRSAFTLFQLLVVLALLALLFALFLPAIAKIRLAAARSQSQNNLKQLALACHNYYDANNVFPPGVDAKHFSTVTYLLPYIEQDNVYKQVDMKKPVTDKENLAIAATRIKVFINPSDEVQVVDKDFGGTNYLFSAGSQYDLKDNDGVFFEKSKIKFPDIADGTSNTVMIGEKHLRSSNPEGANPPGTLYDPNYDIIAYSAGIQGSYHRRGGASWPLAQSPTTPQNMQFGSWHPGIVQFVLADGSVRGLRTSVPGTTLGYLTNINDGNVITNLD